MIFVVLAAGTAGAVIQAQLSPYLPPLAHPATPISVHISGFRWQISGCGEGNRSLSGGFYAAGENLSLSTVVTFPGPAANCTVRSVELAPAEFSLVRSNLPLVVESGGAGTVMVIVGVPTFLEPQTITLSLEGTPS